MLCHIYLVGLIVSLSFHSTSCCSEGLELHSNSNQLVQVAVLPTSEGALAENAILHACVPPGELPQNMSVASQLQSRNLMTQNISASMDSPTYWALLTSASIVLVFVCISIVIVALHPPDVEEPAPSDTKLPTTPGADWPNPKASPNSMSSPTIDHASDCDHPPTKDLALETALASDVDHPQRFRVFGSMSEKEMNAILRESAAPPNVVGIRKSVDPRVIHDSRRVGFATAV